MCVSSTIPRYALAIHAQTVINVATDHPHWTTVIAELTGAASPDAPTAGTVLLFFSPKGGVGKTTIGLNLAVALGQILRQPVAFVDADLQFGDAAAMIPEAPRTTLYDVTQSHVGHDLDLVLRTVTPVTPFVDLLPAPRDPQEAEEITPEALTQVLTTLRSHYTVIVVDTAPALTDITLALIDQADTIVLVCTPERLTIRKMAKTIQVLTHGLHLPPSRLLCLLNRAASVPGFTPDEVSAALHLPIALTLPSDGAYPIRAANLGQPLLLRFPEAALSRALVHWARQFVYAAPSVPNPQRSGQPVLFPAGSSRLS